MSNPESSDSPQVKFVLEWRQSFNKKDVDLIGKSLHEDYRRIKYPRSLGKPDQTKEEWLKEFGEFLNLWAENKLIIHSTIDTPGKVIMHVTNEIKTAFGIDINLESLFMVHIITDEDGSLKIKQIEEFTDSKAYLDCIQTIAAAKAKK